MSTGTTQILIQTQSTPGLGLDRAGRLADTPLALRSVPLDVGLQYEKGGSSKINGGFFWHGLKQAFSGEYSKSGVALNEVKVVGNGHVHTSENCRRTAGIWQCFGGGSSYCASTEVALLVVYADPPDMPPSSRLWPEGPATSIQGLRCALLRCKSFA